MNRTLLALLLLLLVLPGWATATTMDGLWLNQRGTQLRIKSTVTSVKITVVLKGGKSYTAVGSYQGYSTMSFDFLDQGLHKATLVNERTLRLEGPNFVEYYSR